MTPQNYLKNLREDSNISITSLALQTGLKKEIIKDSENPEKKLDIFVFFILEAFFNPIQNKDTPENLPLYSSWLASLKEGDAVILEENTIGTTNNFVYHSELIEHISKEKISLKSKIVLDTGSGSFSYNAPNGVNFNYKIFPASEKINTSKTPILLQKFINLFATEGLI